MKFSLKKIFVFIAILSAIFSCNPTSKEQNLQRVYGAVNCLDVERTERINKIKIGNGKIVYNKDMTFLVTNDSAKYSNLRGTWDLCCSGSDYGNMILILNGYKPFESSTPSFYINVDGKEVKLVFTICQ